MNKITGRAGHTHIKVELLSAFLDSQVSTADQARIEEHIAACSTCQSELHSLRQTVALLGALPRVQVPHAFTLSEAKIGQRSTSTPSWFGGWARGLAAVSAIAAVALIATTLLRQPVSAPAPMVARLATSSDMPAATPQLSVREQEPSAAAVANLPTVSEDAGTTVPELPPPPAAKAFAGTSAAAVSEDQAESAIAPTMPPAAEAKAVTGSQPEDADVGMPKAGPTVVTEEAPPTMLAMAMAVPAETPTAEPAAFGRGGAAPAAGMGMEATQVMEQAPPMVDAHSVLHSGAVVLYADEQGLWSIDGTNGIRSLADSGHAILPMISPDRTWVVFRTQDSGQQEIMVVPYQGGKPRLLLSEDQLPSDNLGQQYNRRRIEDVFWIGQQHELAVRVAANPKDTEALPKEELWSLNIDTGKLSFLLDLGTAESLALSPDATQVALLDFGSEQKPNGGLTLAEIGSGQERKVISVTNSFLLPRDLDQLHWLPDGKDLMVAIPDSAPDGVQPPLGFTIYRVPVEGQVGSGVHIAGGMPVWSDDGAMLSYYAVGESADEPMMLMIASGDGSNPVPYASSQDGGWFAWAPDAANFLYACGDDLYVGSLGQPAQEIGSTTSVIDPQWIAGDQFLSLLSQDDGWALVSRSTSGDSATLAELPRDLYYRAVPTPH